jgi:hypothetical protein
MTCMGVCSAANRAARETTTAAAAMLALLGVAGASRPATFKFAFKAIHMLR